MKICLIIPSLQAGGMERVMSEIISVLTSKPGLELHLILYGISREIFYEIPSTVRIHTPNFEFNNDHRSYYTLLTMIFLRKQVKKINPNSILSFGEIWNNFVLIALYGFKYPIFVSDRCKPDKSLGKLHNLLRKILYPKAKGIIAQTQVAKQIFHSLYNHNNIAVIGNPIREINPRSDIQKENIVLTVGRLISTKHHDELIKIFHSINHLDWKLVIVGYDHLKQKNKQRLNDLVKELNLEKNILLVDKQKDIDKYYLKSKIFAFTSSSEGFPNVIGEAMAAGLPVIAYDCVAGPSELISDNENGFLIPLFDKLKFQERLKFLMENENLAEEMGNHSKELIKAFNVETISENFEKFILNIN